MTEEQILTKAVEKAIAGGLKLPLGWDYISGSLTEPCFVYKDKSVFVVSIYSHDFAKALWGVRRRILDEVGTYLWQYHLMEMALSDNPIKYLESQLSNLV